MLVSLSTLSHYRRSLIRCNDTIPDTQSLDMKDMQIEDENVYEKGDEIVL